MPPKNRLALRMLLAALCLASIGGLALAEDKTTVKITVDSILASFGNPTHPRLRLPGRPIPVKMDPRLSANRLAERLKMMFDYTDYQLMKSQHATSACGGAVAFNLPGGHILQVAPLEVEEGEIALEFAMFRGIRLLMDHRFKMDQGAVLMLIDQHYPNRLYITAISADSSQLTRPEHATRDQGDFGGS